MIVKSLSGKGEWALNHHVIPLNLDPRNAIPILKYVSTFGVSAILNRLTTSASWIVKDFKDFDGRHLTFLQWYGQMTPWCYFDFREMAFKVLGGDLAKRLLGVGVICSKDSLVLPQPWHQGVF